MSYGQEKKGHVCSLSLASAEREKVAKSADRERVKAKLADQLAAQKVEGLKMSQKPQAGAGGGQKIC